MFVTRVSSTKRKRILTKNRYGLDYLAIQVFDLSAFQCEIEFLTGDVQVPRANDFRTKDIFETHC